MRQTAKILLPVLRAVPSFCPHRVEEPDVLRGKVATFFAGEAELGEFTFIRTAADERKRTFWREARTQRVVAVADRGIIRGRRVLGEDER